MARVGDRLEVMRIFDGFLPRSSPGERRKGRRKPPVTRWARSGANASACRPSAKAVSHKTGLRHAFSTDVTRCIYLERLHWVDDEPIALAQICLLPDAGIVTFEQARQMSTYEVLEGVLGWRITDADMSVTAIGSPMEVAAHLRIALHAPLLVLRRTSRLSDGRTCESTVFHIRPERFDLVVRSGVDAKFVG
ncbi:GntR family transcriptional regulator [Burkholderia sp. AU15512]|nr:GntR family transcriptional regulator [Burkholderia sp. AU15512]